MTNSHYIARQLEKSCAGTHEHQALTGGRADARYPQGLCQAICKGLVDELRITFGGMKRILGVTKYDKVKDNEHEHTWTGNGAAWDDITGEQLDPQMVRKARAEESQYIRSQRVWIKCDEVKLWNAVSKLLKRNG